MVHLAWLSLAAVLIVGCSAEFILPTYRPPPSWPKIYRARRDAEEPIWLNQGDVPKAPATGDHPILPPHIDDVKIDPNRRYARSVDWPEDRVRRDAEEPIWLNKGDVPKAPATGDHPILPPHIDDVKIDPNRRYARSVEGPEDRVRRDADEPLWLYDGDVPKAPATGDHPYLPPNIDDINLDPNTRYARSVDSPSARRGGGSHTTSGGSRDTGPTHPGYNRRNARSVEVPEDRERRDTREPQWLYKGDVPKAPATGDHPFLPPHIDDVKIDPNRRYARSVEGPEDRERRDTGEPQWLYQGDVPKAPATGDHPFLPPHIDDVKIDPNRRYARSVDSPSARRGGGSHRTSGGSRDTGPTHPGSNRRNARSIQQPTFPVPFLPKRPIFPRPSPYNPILGDPILIARTKRDIQFPQKPKHYDIVFTGWNPNAKVQPWQKARVKAY